MVIIPVILIFTIYSETPTVMKWGWFCGECVGYDCNAHLELTNNKIVYINDDPYPDPLGSNETKPKKVIEKKISSYIQDSLESNINKKEFLNLNKYTGCPDCYDQCGCWIEVLYSDTTYRTTYDPLKKPDEILKVDSLFNLEYEKIKIELKKK